MNFIVQWWDFMDHRVAVAAVAAIGESWLRGYARAPRERAQATSSSRPASAGCKEGYAESQRLMGLLLSEFANNSSRYGAALLQRAAGWVPPPTHTHLSTNILQRAIL